MITTYSFFEKLLITCYFLFVKVACSSNPVYMCTVFISYKSNMGLPENLAHVFVTGPFLVYVGLAKERPIWVYHVLLLLGIALALFFPFVIFTKKISQYHVWLFVHLLLFVPLLLISGYMKDKTPQIVFSLLLAIGIAAIGYHTIRAYQVIYK